LISSSRLLMELIYFVHLLRSYSYIIFPIFFVVAGS
jgi:hypothetical protein